mmetsp:Transcript_20348/g.42748  ORF Transcript_20348/g.42748 Transcript_20348/m.42748 type:complete len:209 (-) Transcript_20348:198-824(-)
MPPPLLLRLLLQHLDLLLLPLQDLIVEGVRIALENLNHHGRPLPLRPALLLGVVAVQADAVGVAEFVAAEAVAVKFEAFGFDAAAGQFVFAAADGGALFGGVVFVVVIVFVVSLVGVAIGDFARGALFLAFLFDVALVVVVVVLVILVLIVAVSRTLLHRIRPIVSRLIRGHGFHRRGGRRCRVRRHDGGAISRFRDGCHGQVCILDR